MLKVLLNVTDSELQQISGDISFLSQLYQSSDEHLEFDIIHCHRQNIVGRICEKLYAQPNLHYKIRKQLLIRSKLVPFSLYANGFYPDIIHTHLIFPSLSFKTRSIPIVWSSQGVFSEWYDYQGRKDFREVIDLYSILGKKSDAIVSWTQCGADGIASIADIDDSKIFVVPPFVKEVSMIERKDTLNKNRILFVGHETRRKGLCDLLDACRLLKQSSCDFTIDVVGKTEQKFESLYNDLKVTWHGVLEGDAVKRLFARCDLFVVPTRAETFGLVFLEAMAFNLPIVAYDIRPINEIVENNRQGILVAEGNIKHLAEAIEVLLTDRGTRKRIIELQKNKLIYSYSQEVVLKRIEEVYTFAVRSRKLSKMSTQ